jgi:hypothetical protein
MRGKRVFGKSRVKAFGRLKKELGEKRKNVRKCSIRAIAEKILV